MPPPQASPIGTHDKPTLKWLKKFLNSKRMHAGDQGYQTPFLDAAYQSEPGLFFLSSFSSPPFPFHCWLFKRTLSSHARHTRHQFCLATPLSPLATQPHHLQPPASHAELHAASLGGAATCPQLVLISGKPHWSLLPFYQQALALGRVAGHTIPGTKKQS